MDNILKVDYKKYRLDNGLEVILYQDGSLPVTAVNIWYRVGSASERKGKTGFAHLFEHMMFQGSKNVGKQQHFKFIQEAGGVLNGSTSLDRTNYYQSLPSNYLELALWLESDRMGFLLPALTQEKLDNQIDVVRNERRQRYDNAPYGLAWQIINENMYPENHPYHWPTIGYMDDISGIKLDEVRDFFKKYYSPDNASLVIAGDIDVSETELLVEKYFSPVKSEIRKETVTVPEFSITENKYITHTDNVELPRLYIALHSCPSYCNDEAALDHIAHLLTGSKNSRLYKSLVFEKQIAQNVTSYQHSAKLDGMFIIVATPQPGITTDQLKDEIFRQLDELIKNGITADEITRSRNGIKSAFIYSMQNIGSIADQLNSYNFYLGEPDSFLYDLERYQQTDQSAVRAAAEKYLTQPYLRVDVVPDK